MRGLIQIVLCLALVGGAGLLAKWLVDNRPVAEKATPQVRHPLVRVVEARVEPFELSVEGRGEVSPREVVLLVSEVEGRVIALSEGLVSGGAFNRGDVLVELDPADLLAARERAAARLEEARALLAIEVAEAESAARNLSALNIKPAGDLALRGPQVAQARALVEASTAELEKADRDVGRSMLRAPFDGRVRIESVGLGQLVSRGQVLGELFSTDLAEVRVPVHDADLASLDLGAFGVIQDGPVASLEADFAGSTRRWSGRVLRVEGEVDRASRMVTLVVGVDDPFGSGSFGAGAPLMPGLFVDVTVTGRTEPNGVRLPRSAMRGEGRVFVIDDEDRLRFREVQVVWRGESGVLVAGGLRDGERVCTSPISAPVDGERVEVIPEVEGPGARR